jgi:hypothetical protein
MGLHNDVAVALAAWGAAVPGMNGASEHPVDEIGDTPFVVVGPPKGQLLQPGSWERLLIFFSFSIYLPRTGILFADAATANDAIDAFLLALQTGITLGGKVTEAIIKSWDTNLTDTLGGSDYLTPTIYVAVEVERTGSYTA